MYEQKRFVFVSRHLFLLIAPDSPPIPTAFQPTRQLFLPCLRVLPCGKPSSASYTYRVSRLAATYSYRQRGP